MPALIMRVFGLRHRDGRNVSRTELDAMAAALRAGAPAGASTRPAAVIVDGSVGLGTVRIAGPAASDDESALPYRDRETGIIVSGDVRFYDRKALASSLGRDAETTSAAGRLLVDAYLQWGETFPARIRGDFALAIWDPRRQSLLIARDHLGCAPLFYGCEGDTVAFASHVPGVLAAFDSGADLDPDWVPSLLVCDQTDLERTAYRTVRRALPAHVYRTTGAGLARRRYWDLDARDESGLGSDREYEAALRARLEEAVRVRMPDTDAALGSELSGGLDSSTVASLASAAAAERGLSFTAFSHVLPDDAIGAVWPHADERDWAGQLRRHAGIARHVAVTASGETIVESLRQHIRRYGAPTTCRYGLASGPLYEQAHAHAIATLFSGFGGDQMVSGSASRAARGGWAASLLPWRRGDRRRRLLAHGGARARAIVGALPLRPGWAEEWSLVARAEAGWHAPAEAGSVRAYERHAVQQAGIVERLESYSISAGAWGIRAAHPLLDVPLLEFFHGVPAAQKRRDSWGRYLFRRSIGDLVPEAIRWRPGKQGATIPDGLARFRGAEMSIRALLARARTCPELAFVDFDALNRWADAVFAAASGRDGRTAADLRLGRFNALLGLAAYYDLRASGWRPGGPT